MKKLLFSFVFFGFLIINISLCSNNKYERLQKKNLKYREAYLKKVRYHIFDFKRCKPSFKGITFGFGSMHFQTIGLSKHGCVMLYGKEIENPAYDRRLNRICVVPKKTGRLKLKIGNMGINMSKIEPYCVSTPKNSIRTRKRKRRLYKRKK